MTTIEERELWHMPIVLIALLGLMFAEWGIAHGGWGSRDYHRGTEQNAFAVVGDSATLCWSSASVVVLCPPLLLPASANAQNTHLAVIVGLAGEARARRTVPPMGGDARRSRVGPARHPARAHRLSAREARAGREARNRQFDEGGDRQGARCSWRTAAGADDTVFIVLIGHGTFDGKIAKFNLPGPDMTPADFAAALKRFASKKVVFVNTASASGPFVEALAGPGRTIVTATRTGAERFATLFGGYFVDALASDAADADKNRRVSVLEAFNAAKIDVARAYEKQGIMVTEHPLLEDGGDGEGSLEPVGRRQGRPDRRDALARHAGVGARAP